MRLILKLLAVVCWLVAIPFGVIALLALAQAYILGAVIPGSLALLLFALGIRAWTHRRNGEPRKKRRGCGCCALFLGILVLLCCGGVGGLLFHVNKAMSEDPRVIADVTGQIAEISIPEALTPQVSCNQKVPFSGRPMQTWVLYVDESTRSMLMLASVWLPPTARAEAQMRRFFESWLQREGLWYAGHVGVWKTHENEIEVRGENVTFRFATCEVGSGNMRVQVKGTFPGKQMPVMLSFSGDAEKYDEEAIVKMIESIR